MKVALVYDRVNKWGGAERILLSLHKIFPEAPLYTAVYNRETARWADVFTIKTSFLQYIPLARSHHEFFAPLMAFAFERFNFDEYDVVISVTSEAAKGIITTGKTRHVCICLTPTRYLWSGYPEYFKNPIVRFITKPLIAYMRNWDKKAAQRPNKYIAISSEVKDRIKKYYSREATVIYPAVERFYPILQSKTPGDYFLVVSRLSKFTQYKRVDLAVKAATKLHLPLKIVGDGDVGPFKRFAGQTVEFVGKISDTELALYYANCKALIFPAHEDFGLVMVEAQLAGKPVIAYNAGGAKEIVIEGKTGTFFNQQTVSSLSEVLENFKEKAYNSKDCLVNGQRFSRSSFTESIRSYIKL